MAVPMPPTPSSQAVRMKSALSELDSTLQEALEQDAQSSQFQREWRQQWDLQDAAIADRLRILNEKLLAKQGNGDLPTTPRLKVLS